MKARSVRIEGNSVYVPLDRSGRREAVIDFDSYRELLELGLMPNWNSLGGNVMARGGNGARVLVARVLLNAQSGQVVSFKDSDRLNLRRDNLGLRSGFAINYDRALLQLDRSEVHLGRASAPIMDKNWASIFTPIA